LNVAAISNRQTTIASPAGCTGVGLHSGKAVALTLLPAEAGTGRVFRRTDIDGTRAYIDARYDNVGATELGTTLTNAAGVSVSTVEHLMAALAGLGIDNVVVEVAGPEIPIMDGSAEPFIGLIERGGQSTTSAARSLLRVLKPVEVADGARRAALLPAEEFTLACDIAFDAPAIGHQSIEVELTPWSFRREIGAARTFGFLADAERLKAKGLALGAGLENTIVVGDDGVINEEPLRFGDEFVRHKLLDAVGDLALAGAPIAGRYEGVRAGHALNNRLLRALFADPDAWRLERAPAEPAAGSVRSALGAEA
jgi:UDP-3-O-[3-hydroxymyristoyl] N-acetylglucosamine deacetylase